MITSSGVHCDVCGNYILPLDPDERVNEFGVRGIDRVLHCHNTCKISVRECGQNWERLPPGPLRTAFADASARLAAADRGGVRDE